jgi:hypothetical protein
LKLANYNPFGKSIDKLDKDDLGKLITQKIVEGFYIEYKREFVKPEKIAQSVASFANTYGGWYFIGIVSDETDNSAKSLCGFDHTIYKDPTPQVMNPIRDHLSHMPLLDYRIVEISETHSVFVIYVPEGIETPYIHKNGRIYRRAADASDPIYEKDRYALDRLVDRGRQEQDKFREFCQDDRTFDGNDNQAWVNIYLRPQPRGIINKVELINYSTVEELLEKSRTPHSILDGVMTVNLVLDKGYALGDSVILRQVGDERLALYNTLTLQLFANGSAKIHLPLTKLTDLSQFDTKEVHFYLQNLIKKHEEFSQLRFVETGNIFYSLASLTKYYIDYLNISDMPISIWSRISVQNAWRIVPVMDSPRWIELVDKVGLPICQHDLVSFPNAKANAIELKDAQVKNLGLQLFGFVLACIGANFGEKYQHIYTDELQAKLNLMMQSKERP